MQSKACLGALLSFPHPKRSQHIKEILSPDLPALPSALAQKCVANIRVIDDAYQIVALRLVLAWGD